jgi:hypothetical protein
MRDNFKVSSETEMLRIRYMMGGIVLWATTVCEWSLFPLSLLFFFFFFFCFLYAWLIWLSLLEEGELTMVLMGYLVRLEDWYLHPCELKINRGSKLWLVTHIMTLSKPKRKSNVFIHCVVYCSVGSFWLAT